MSDRVGQQIGNYRIERLLGSGGFADVYLGKHIYLDSLVAIKLLKTNLAEGDIEDFRSEARTLVRLIRARIWKTGATEPAGWMLTATDYSFSSGIGGLRPQLNQGATLQVSMFQETVATKP